MDDSLIRRSDAIDALGEEPEVWSDTEEEWAYRNAWVEHIAAIKALPSADRPKGEWIDWLGTGNEWECSECKCSIESHGSIAYKFCPMCGADMRGEDDGSCE